MKKLIQFMTLVLGTAFLAGCESTPKAPDTQQAAASRPYQSWSTAQLQSKRTQLMLDSTKPDMTIDPVNGGSSISPNPGGHNRQLDAINAELLLRDPSGKLIGKP